MLMRKKPLFLRRRHKRAGCDLLEDTLAQTKLDYAFNLVAGGALRVRRSWPEDIELLHRLVDAANGKGAPDSRESLTAAQAAIYMRRLKALVRRHGGEPRPPAPSLAPLADNLRLIADAVGLEAIDVEILQFAIACTERDMRDLVDPIPCDSKRVLTRILGAALARPASAVDQALRKSGRLLGTGLLKLGPHGDVDDWLEVDARLLESIGLEGLTSEKLMDRYIPMARPPTLAVADYAHLAAEVDLARRVLAGAVAERKVGVNLLLHGPTGTGKSELACLLSSVVGTPLYLAGREGDEGESPDAEARLRSLLLGNRILGAGRALMVFDELEDLFESNAVGRLFGGGADERTMSKLWFNAMLESNAVPTIWISNDVSGMDPAFVRRFSLVMEVGALTASQRRRAWAKHLGGESALPANDVERLSQEYKVSPAQIGTAVATARLASGGAVDRATLEAVLAPTEKVLHGARAKEPTFDAGRYFPEVLNTAPVDLEDVATRLVGLKAGSGVSLCLYGPPGTGKSEYVRYLAHRMDRRLVFKRVSDLMSMWVGGTEQQIAAAFEEARKENAVLLFDEADSFLQDRRTAQRSWEVTMVNELLQQMESFTGIFACTTNLFQNLDQASLRRFTFKIPFAFLRPAQAELMFRRTLAELGGELRENADVAVVATLLGITNLTPGDFAAVARRMKTLGEVPTARRLLDEVRVEVRVKEGAKARMGF
jgi:transitional endoplasmic reticulum ATPase